MPLAFRSLSHGTVAFGFFNVATDAMLLDRLFFFASDFCAAVVDLCARGRASMGGWRIDEQEGVGDLHGAIAGRDHSGLIGATYARWPFPADPDLFHQDPAGHVSRAEARGMMETFGEAGEIVLRVEDGGSLFHIGSYVFDLEGFAALVEYVDRGGWPRWRDGERPACVVEMVEAASGIGLLARADRGRGRC